MFSLTREKLAQAKELVHRHGFGAWVTFVRETAEGSDPVLPLILDGGLTWQSALIVTAQGTCAVVGNYDADPLMASGDWDEVVPYVQDIGPDLLRVIESRCPAGSPIAVNMSENDVKADGLTVGMKKLLDRYLEGWQLVSSEELVMELRGVKTQEELRRIKGAIAEGDRIFAEIEAMIPGRPSEMQVQRAVHRTMAQRGLGFGWDKKGNPIVNSGPDSMIGHGIPSDSILVSEGHIFHVDLGVIWEGYSSDIQRCWFIGAETPPEVESCLDAVNGAISAGASVLKPGVLGWQVDQAARDFIVAAGYPEYRHALGHQVGRVAHDGGAILGPRWARYGRTPEVPVKEGEVYTLELGVTLPGRGYLGIEEIVVVTKDGCEFISERQLTMPTIHLYS